MYTQLRSALEILRGSRITDHDWLVLVEGHSIASEIERLEEGGVSEAAAVEHVEELGAALLPLIDALEVSRRIKSKRMREKQDLEQPLTSDGNARAVAMLAAEEARRDEGVKSFRETYLGDGLVDAEDIPRWVSEAAERDGAPSRLVLVPVDAPSVPSTWSDAQQLGLHFYSTSRMLLDFPSEDEGWRGVVPVRLGGVLNDLRVVSEALARRYGWQPALATAFILSDVSPLVRPIEVTFQERSWRPSARIVLTVDPLLSSKKVAAIYRIARTEFYTHGYDSRQEPRYTEISERRASLAVFAFKYSEGHTWAEVQKIWNREHPEWKYDKNRATQFIRDARDAYKRVSGGKDLDWQGGGK